MTDDEIVDAMHAYGGSFERALARAWRCADESNQARIKATWPDLFEEYRELAAHAQAADARRLLDRA